MADDRPEPAINRDTATGPGPLQVVIVGGGVAALEATLALSELAGERVEICLVAPNREFVYRPMTVLEPFVGGRAERFPLRSIVGLNRVRLRADRLEWVEARHRTIHTRHGPPLEYGALLLCLGSEARVAFRYAVTIGMEIQSPRLRAVVRELETGTCRSLAVVVPTGHAWPLPAYEFALLARTRSRAARILVISSDTEPLAAFGQDIVRHVGDLLQERRIELLTGQPAVLIDGGHIRLSPRERSARTMDVDRIVALPRLYGPHVRGLPGAPGGFLPVDAYCRVSRTSGVFAAGDGTDFPIKHGGVAAQHAVAAVRSIAALAGVRIACPPFSPVLEGLILTGEDPVYASAQYTGGRAFRSQIASRPLRAMPEKLQATHLVPVLERLRPVYRPSSP